MSLHEWLSLCQWPAMALSIIGSWYIGDPGRKHRRWGFAVLILSNGLWMSWGSVDHAWALLVMQVLYIILNGRGLFQNAAATGTVQDSTRQTACVGSAEPG